VPADPAEHARQVVEAAGTFQRSRNADLRVAVVRGDAQEVLRRLEQGADLEGHIVGEGAHASHLSPLQEAALNGHVRVIEVLVERGAALERTALGFGTALHLAAWAGKLDAVCFLVEHGARLDALVPGERRTPLDVAEGAGQVEVIAYLLSRGAPRGSELR
jgi:hypothetical protein